MRTILVIACVGLVACGDTDEAGNDTVSPGDTAIADTGTADTVAGGDTGAGTNQGDTAVADTASGDTTVADTTPAAPSCYGPHACEVVAGGLIGGCESVGCTTGACFGKFNDMPFFCNGIDENECGQGVPRGWCTWNAERKTCMNNGRCFGAFTTSESCNAATPGGNSCIWEATKCSGTAPNADDFCEGLSAQDRNSCRYPGCIWGTNPPE